MVSTIVYKPQTMRIAVTGGSGDIGTYVCDELIEQGHEVVCLDTAEPKIQVEFRQCDLTSLEVALKTVADCEQIVHLAAIPDPFGDLPLEAVLGRNTVLAYNVFEAARRSGIRRVVYAGSESGSGFGIHEAELSPLYLPIDEAHPLWCHEAYSLSKYFGERIGANYAKAFGLEVVSLRYPHVWLRRNVEAVKHTVAQARRGNGLAALEPKDRLGAYIAVRDVARAFAAATSFQFGFADTPFEAFYLSARNTCIEVPTLELARARFGSVPPLKDARLFEDNPHASMYDIRKAERLLDWKPVWTWQDFEQWEL